MSRKLATIRKISEIKPIEGADKIELAIIDGWQCVVKKNEFNVGDTCIYCEIDSFLPIKPEFEFLRTSSYKKMGDIEGFRLKTIRMKGQISQGLVLPISVLPEGPYCNDLDVTEILGIKLYEAPVLAQLQGQMRGNFPHFISKTDEERV